MRPEGSLVILSENTSAVVVPPAPIMSWLVSKLPDRSIKGVLVASKSKVNWPDGAWAQESRVTRAKMLKRKKSLAHARPLVRWLFCTGRTECRNLRDIVKRKRLGKWLVWLRQIPAKAANVAAECLCDSA